MPYIFLIGRILFSWIFIMKAFDHFTTKPIAQAASMGIPAASVLVPIAGILALVGGLSILLGYKGKWGAWLLVVFLFITAFGIHRFWQAQDAFGMAMHHFCFWKNISMVGAALMLTYFGTGPYSLDQRFEKKRKK